MKTLLSVILFSVAFLCANGAFASEIEIIDLRVEEMKSPLGVENKNPCFSWGYQTRGEANRGFKQHSYRIKVASTKELINLDKGDVWESQIIEDERSHYIPYSGSELRSSRRYFWKVYHIDNLGNVVGSESSYFEMGLLSDRDWCKAKWIGKRKEMSCNIPSKVEKWTDYDVESDVKILSNSANFLFRATYTTELCYIAQIELGRPGIISVYKNVYGNKTLLSTIKAHKNIVKGKKYKVKISAYKNEIKIYLDNTLLNEKPIIDSSFLNGTVGVGAINANGDGATATFDNFKVSNCNGTLYQDEFDSILLNNFQDILFHGSSICEPRMGRLYLNSTNSLLEIKKGQEAPLLRKDFYLGKNIKSAKAYVSGLGYYEMSINGKKVGDSQLEPGYSRYDSVAYYSVYDITALLESQNVVGFELGRGWYGMTTPTLWGEFRAKDWLGEPRIKAVLKIEYADGRVENIITDESFKLANSPIIFESIKAGEYYDARKEMTGWNSVGYDDSKWSDAVCVNGNGASLTSQMFEPIKEEEAVQAKLIKKIGQDFYYVDFGRHIAGNVELKVKGECGTKVRMQYAERMEDNGFPSIWRFEPTQTGCYQQDIYVLKGKGVETYQAKFSYKGFRYIIITGFPGIPTVDNFKAKVINSSMERVGEFESSSDLFNKISEASRRSIQSNMHSIPTDCPTFEKLGWTCDDAAPLEAMAYYYNIDNMYKKRLKDYAQDISQRGEISDVLPSTWGLKCSDPAWNGSYVAILWKMYIFYGNKELLSEHYANLEKYINRLTMQSTNYIITIKEDKGYGDWCPPDHVGGRGPEGLSLYHTSYYYWYVTLMSKIAKEIGKEADVKKYDELALRIKDAINLRYFISEENAYYFPKKVGGYRQAAQVLPLYFDIVPKEKAQAVADKLANDVIMRDKHLWVGILGFEYIADVLAKYGYLDLAYEIHLKDDFPSVGNMIREGATTLWESYSLSTTRSLNHKMYSPISEWFFKCVSGLNPDESSPGFQKAIISPQPYVLRLKRSKCRYKSIYGFYESEWIYSNGKYTYNITIPPNCTAKLRIPCNANINISESNCSVWENNIFKRGFNGIFSGEKMDSYIEFEIGAGTYKFEGCEKR
ncbi:MAG: family 78 glycoside hydrolase catalytic domain [Muribaculaceae bacterium]|nr:family 78 glycoside hydrolase catalytic domain [Muribaculaceae bacterium]